MAKENETAEAAAAPAEEAETEAQAPAEAAEAAPVAAAPAEDGKEAAADDKPKANKVKAFLGRAFSFLLCILLVVVLAFEAGAVYLWLNYDKLVDVQEPDAAQTAPRRSVTSSAYANSGGAYRPPDWPEPVSAYASIPPYERGEEPVEEPLEPDGD